MAKRRQRSADWTGLATKLRAWFDREKRDLPWRRTRDPYAIWVSETMLQQTQVETVKPFYDKFLRAFPTVRDLAAADLQEVLKLWAGLGYYRRARNMLAAARAMVEKHGGEVPGTVAQLLELPGVGKYTAGAVASIAFGVRAAAVDGNVVRVLARLGEILEPIGSAQTMKRLWVMAESLVPSARPGEHNQALMELGARVCLPRNARCGECPLREMCQGFMNGTAAGLPVRGKRRETPVVRRIVVVLRREDAPETSVNHDGIRSSNFNDKSAQFRVKNARLCAKNGVVGTSLGNSVTAGAKTRGNPRLGGDPGVGGGVNRECDDFVLVMQRPRGVLWEEMWEFPTFAIRRNHEATARLTSASSPRVRASGSRTVESSSPKSKPPPPKITARPTGAATKKTKDKRRKTKARSCQENEKRQDSNTKKIGRGEGKKDGAAEERPGWTAREVREMVRRELGVEARIDRACGVVVHQLSHRRMEYEVWVGEALRGKALRHQGTARLSSPKSEALRGTTRETDQGDAEARNGKCEVRNATCETTGARRAGAGSEDAMRYVDARWVRVGELREGTAVAMARGMAKVMEVVSG